MQGNKERAKGSFKERIPHGREEEEGRNQGGIRSEFSKEPKRKKEGNKKGKKKVKKVLTREGRGDIIIKLPKRRRGRLRDGNPVRMGFQAGNKLPVAP